MNHRQKKKLTKRFNSRKYGKYKRIKKVRDNLSELIKKHHFDTSTEYVKGLENIAILATGVPSVIMEYAGSKEN